MIKELLKLLRIIFTPTCWLQNDPYSSEYDKSLRSALRNPKFSSEGNYTIVLNGKEIWISNYPYAYGMPHSLKYRSSGYRPSRRTIFWLRDAVIEYQLHGNKSDLKIVNPRTKHSKGGE